MKTNPFTHPTGRAIVYVREADRSDLPEHVAKLPGKLFSVHDPEGNCIAVSPDRRQAFALAKRNDLVPVSVH